MHPHLQSHLQLHFLLLLLRFLQSEISNLKFEISGAFTLAPSRAIHLRTPSLDRKSACSSMNRPFSCNFPPQRTLTYFPAQFHVLYLDSLLACLEKLRMHLSNSNSPQKTAQPTSPIRQSRIEFLIEMKTIRNQAIPLKTKDKKISNRNITGNASINHGGALQSRRNNTTWFQDGTVDSPPGRRNSPRAHARRLAHAKIWAICLRVTRPDVKPQASART